MPTSMSGLNMLLKHVPECKKLHLRESQISNFLGEHVDSDPLEVIVAL